MFKVSIQVLYQTLDRRERLYCGLELAREGQWGLNWTYKEELCYYYLLHTCLSCAWHCSKCITCIISFKMFEQRYNGGTLHIVFGK